MMWSFGGWFGALWMVLFWGAILWGIVWIARSAGSRPEQVTTSRDRALDILEARFARGEIDALELEERRSDLLTGR